MNRITVRGTDGTERTYPLHGGTLAIGRDPGCAICLQDAQVSWQHAVLSHDGGTCVIEDLGSSNGTFVGAERIRRQVLNAGEIVRIGPYELALQLQATPSPTSASEHTMFDMVAFRAATPVARPNEQTAKQQALGADRSLAHWLRSMPLSESYRTASLRQEIVAGLTVAALVVPQGMAYALLAGLPPAMGLYASVLPMIVYALAGSGRQTSVGPVTVDSLMLVLGLSTL
ncbi:MAG TPA: SulP family inorganic anion transporter, partial [Steroidobacteraceae bacterium]|nr:SulP family inorganic anion transporter [Steroidobacteraceae bacterium]